VQAVQRAHDLTLAPCSRSDAFARDVDMTLAITALRAFMATQSALLLQVAEQLREEGLQVHYRRVPLSRNRTPVALDLQELHNSVFVGGPDLENVKFVVVARAASTSTSSSFVAHFLATCIDAAEEHAAHGGVLRCKSGGLHASSWAGAEEPASPGQQVPLLADEGRSAVALMGSASQGNVASSPVWRAVTRTCKSMDGSQDRLANSTISNLCRCAASDLSLVVVMQRVTS
jgi:hypothetical protein